jgi:glycosyltransferase involved in cell wall biosynthesis
LFKLLKDAAETWRLVRAQREDLVLVHAFGAPNIAGIVIARAARCPLVWSVHEVFSSKSEMRVFRRLLRAADARVACSQYVADQFGAAAITFRVVRSGTDVAESGDPLFTHSTTRVICVGRLNRWKGQDVLLDAFARLPDELQRRCELQLVGSAFEADADVEERLVTQVASLNLKDRVALLGERADARALMARADVVVVPSTKPEPFGKVVIEGMALGRVVIATTPGGPAEVISGGKDGVLVPLGDAEALSAALADVLRDPAASRAMGELARATARRFSSRSTIKGYLSVYRELPSRIPA